jgi:uncharacterized membrane protein YqjE
VSARPGPRLQSDRADAELQETAIPGATLIDVVKSLFKEVWSLARDHARLITLEAQLAGRTLIAIVFAAVVSAVLLVTAWLGVIASLMFWLVGDDAAWAWAFLGVSLVHIALSSVIFIWIRRTARGMLFAATLRQLEGEANQASASTQSAQT